MFSVSGFVIIGIFLVALFWLLVIGAIVSLVVYSVKYNRQDNKKRDEIPLQILKERYARGEIDSREFQRKKKELQE